MGMASKPLLTQEPKTYYSQKLPLKIVNVYFHFYVDIRKPKLVLPQRASTQILNSPFSLRFHYSVTPSTFS